MSVHGSLRNLGLLSIKKDIKKRAFNVQTITEVLYNKICKISKYLEKKRKSDSDL